MREFAQSNACLFGTMHRCEQSFSVLKIITNQTEIAMVQFQLEELSVAFSYEFNS